MSMPRMDVHCWVVRNGEVIDPWFEQYSIITMIRHTTQQRVYKEAPEETQRIIAGIFETYYGITLSIDFLIDVPVMFGHCYRNAMKEIHIHGGELKIGSCGFVRDDGSVWWEYGGIDYRTVSDFKL